MVSMIKHLSNAGIITVCDKSSCLVCSRQPKLPLNLCKIAYTGDWEHSIFKVFHMWVNTTSPIWWRQANHNRGLFKISWMLIHAAVLCPVLAYVVSNTIPHTQSLQFQFSSRTRLAFATECPIFWVDLIGIAGTPSSLVPPSPEIISTISILNLLLNN